MRLALVALVLLAAAGCGTATRQLQQRPAVDVHWPPVAEATRAKWYRRVEQAPAEPVTLPETELEHGLAAAADETGVPLVKTHYLPLLGGTAELIVQPPEPNASAAKLSASLGPLGRDQRPYLVTIVDADGDAPLVLGWAPHVGGAGAIGEGVAWEAPGFDSGVILGKPVVIDPAARRRHSLPAATAGQTLK
jgi:hypothetical protein